MTSETVRESRGRWLPLVLAIALFALVGATAGLRHPEDADERLYHLPSVLLFARQFPHFDLVNYRAASGPFLYMVLAAWVRLFGSSLVGLRVAVALFGLGALVALWKLLEGASRRVAVLTLALILANQYFLFRSFSLYTVVPAFCFGVIGLLGFERWRLDPARPWALIASALAISLAVLTRQIYVSFAAGLLAWSVLARLGVVARDTTPRFRPGWGALALLLLPAACVLALMRLWGGTTPPGFTMFFGHNVVNVRQLDFVPLFFGFWFWPILLEDLRGLRRWLLPALVLVGVHVAFGTLRIFLPLDNVVMGTLATAFSTLLRSGVPSLLLRVADAVVWGIGVLALVVTLRDGSRPYAFIVAAHLAVIAVIPLVYERYYLPVFLCAWLGAGPHMRRTWPYVVMIVQLAVTTFAYFATHR